MHPSSRSGALRRAPATPAQRLQALRRASGPRRERCTRGLRAISRRRPRFAPAPRPKPAILRTTPEPASSLQLERAQPQKGRERRCDPKADDDARLRPPAELKMVMKRRHLENPLPRNLERQDLRHDRERLGNEYRADDGEKELALDEDRDGAQRGPERERAGVAHEDVRRMAVPPQESQRGPD